MENLFKGYITSILGLLGIILILLHSTGYYEFPNPDFLSKKGESIIGIIICAGFFALPYSKIESAIEGLFNWVIDKIKSLF